MSDDESEGLTYAEAGVDIEASEEATKALLSAVGETDDEGYAGILDLGELEIGLTTDGVGSKLLVAEALDRFDTIGIDCIAMNVNDLVAEGLRPVGFVDYLALEEPDEELTAAIGVGLAAGAKQADITLMGGETAILPEVIVGVDLAGAALGIAHPGERPPGVAKVGDAIVGMPSAGIHSNGLTLARKAVTSTYEYDDTFSDDPSRTVGETLLEPTRIYTEPIEVMRRFEVHACAHITGGGLRNLSRMADHRYEIDDPLPVQPVFDLIQNGGKVSDIEMYRTFNMGIGFAMAVDATDADQVAELVDGAVIGSVIEGSGVAIEGLDITE